MSETAIQFDGVGKMYRLYGSRRENLLDALGLTRFLPGAPQRYREFWALRDVDFVLGRGERMGIIGRNGAGKTTLLKLVTGNLPPTEGTVAVDGSVQALLEIGGGLHPEFTGRENIHAALAYANLSAAQLRAVEDDIAEFTELDQFLEQPFKTYSLGMQSRLSFAIATAVTPEILIVDEVLGAGDAYFFTKSSERMRALIEGGASVLLVSHALDQITRFCENAVWLDRGQIVMRGQSLEVVKAYERFIRKLEDERLRVRNRRRLGGSSALGVDEPSARLLLRFEGTYLDVAEVALLQEGKRVETLAVGAPQDADLLQPASVILQGSDWSTPAREGDRYWRNLAADGDGAAAGSVAFALAEEGAAYSVDIAFRATGPSATVEVWIDDTRVGATDLASDAGDWSSVTVDLAESGVASPETSSRSETGLSYWPTDGDLEITDITLFDEHGTESAVFPVGYTLRLRVSIRASRGDRYRLLPAAVFYRLDGVNVTTAMGEWTELTLAAGAEAAAELELGELNLGNGSYVVSVTLYKEFDELLHEAPTAHAIVDRSVEFKVVGTPPAINSVFQHPGRWSVVDAGRAEPTPRSAAT